MAPSVRAARALLLALAASAIGYSLGVRPAPAPIIRTQLAAVPVLISRGIAAQTIAPSVCMSEASPLSFPDELLLASKGDGGYNKQLIATIGVGLHCVLPMATISSVLLDGDIARSLELTSSQVVLSDSLILAAGRRALPRCSGPISDALGRKGTSLAFAALAAAAMAPQTQLQPGADAELQLCALRALAGFAVGGYLAPAFSWLVESVESGERGRTGTAWTLGYVVGVAFVALLHVALPGGWRAEEAAYSACVVAAIGASALLVTESPRWLFAVGDRAGALDALRSAARRSGLTPSCAARAAPTRSAARRRRAHRRLGCELGDEDVPRRGRRCSRESCRDAAGLVAPPLLADGDDGDGGADARANAEPGLPAARVQRRLLRAVFVGLAERRARPQLCCSRPPTCSAPSSAAGSPRSALCAATRLALAGASITAPRSSRAVLLVLAAAPRRRRRRPAVALVGTAACGFPDLAPHRRALPDGPPLRRPRLRRLRRQGGRRRRRAARPAAAAAQRPAAAGACAAGRRPGNAAAGGGGQWRLTRLQNTARRICAAPD